MDATLAKSGVDLIAEERRRQVEQEGWTPEHDAGHVGSEMVFASICYARTATALPLLDNPAPFLAHPQHPWPWAPEWWKPSADPVRNLVKAGALIAAEIDRLQRAAGAPRYVCTVCTTEWTGEVAACPSCSSRNALAHTLENRP